MSALVLRYEDFVNQNTINIFTDASMGPEAGYMSSPIPSCYGFITMHLEYEINSGVFIDTYGSVNRAEIKGIKSAVFEAIRLRNTGFTGTINIFSDSQISIFGIRDRIFDWDYNGGYLVNNSGNAVANQSEYIEIMQLLVQYNPCVNFYHVKGHLTGKKKNVNRGINVFRMSNFNSGTDVEIDRRFIRFISLCNNQIDAITRWHLRHQLHPEGLVYRDAFKFVPTSEYDNQLQAYREIVEGDNEYV